MTRLRPSGHEPASAKPPTESSPSCANPPAREAPTIGAIPPETPCSEADLRSFQYYLDQRLQAILDKHMVAAKAELLRELMGELHRED